MKNYSDLYDVLLKRIKILTESDFFYSKESFRKPLSRVILDFFPLLKWLAEVSEKNDDIEALFEKFRGAYRLSQNDSIKFVEYSKKSLEDFEDEMNYLKICVMNVCGVDVDNFNGENLPKKENLEFDFKSQKSDDIRDSEFVYKNFLGDFEDSVGSALKNSFVKAQARFQIEKKIRSGEIYIYKNKPKRNLFIKLMVGLLWVVGLAFSILWAFKYRERSTDSKSDVVLIVFPIIYFLWNLFYLFRSLKNDNYKYSFQRSSFILVILFSFILMIIAIAKSPVDDFKKVTDLFVKISAIGTTSAWFSSSLVYLVAYLYLQPKEDKEFLDKLMDEHASDSSGTLPINN